MKVIDEVRQARKSFQTFKYPFKVRFYAQSQNDIFLIQLTDTQQTVSSKIVTRQALAKMSLDMFFESPMDLCLYLIEHIEQVNIYAGGVISWKMQLVVGVGKVKEFGLATEKIENKEVATLNKKVEKLEEQLQLQILRHEDTKRELQNLRQQARAASMKQAASYPKKDEENRRNIQSLQSQVHNLKVDLSKYQKRYNQLYQLVKRLSDSKPAPKKEQPSPKPQQKEKVNYISQIKAGEENLSFYAFVYSIEQAEDHRYLVFLADQTGMVEALLPMNKWLKPNRVILLENVKAVVIDGHIQIRFMSQGKIETTNRSITDVCPQKNISYPSPHVHVKGQTMG